MQFSFRKYPPPVLAKRYGAHAAALNAQDCPGWEVEKCHVPIPEDRVPPVLVGRYRAHATALHAQDCPDWDLESVFLPWDSYKNVPFSSRE